MSIKKLLSNVYKARQCCDVDDVEIALDKLREIENKYGHTPATRARRRSLERRMLTVMK